MMEPDDPPGVDPKTMGLYPKYDVINKATGELVTEPVFVLKPDSDRHAREALRRYAVSAFEGGYEPLAQDIYGWLTGLDAQDIAAERERRDKLRRIEGDLRDQLNRLAKSYDPDDDSILGEEPGDPKRGVVHNAEIVSEEEEVVTYDGFGAPIINEQYDPETHRLGSTVDFFGEDPVDEEE